jgi:hypothetical protein
MATGFNVQSSAALPTINTSSNTQQQQVADQNTGTNLNVYTGAQQAAQGNVLSGLQGLLSGTSSVPQSLGMSAQAMQQAMSDFNQFNAPQYAAVNGAGSPAIQSARDQYMARLQATSSQNAVQNALSAYSAQGQYAFTPQGNTTQGANLRNLNAQTNQTDIGLDTGNALGNIMHYLTGGNPSAGGTFPVSGGTGATGGPIAGIGTSNY